MLSISLFTSFSYLATEVSLNTKFLLWCIKGFHNSRTTKTLIMWHYWHPSLYPFVLVPIPFSKSQFFSAFYRERHCFISSLLCSLRLLFDLPHWYFTQALSLCFNWRKWNEQKRKSRKDDDSNVRSNNPCSVAYCLHPFVPVQTNCLFKSSKTIWYPTNKAQLILFHYVAFAYGLMVFTLVGYHVHLDNRIGSEHKKSKRCSKRKSGKSGYFGRLCEKLCNDGRKQNAAPPLSLSHLRRTLCLTKANVSGIKHYYQNQQHKCYIWCYWLCG